MRTPEAGPGTRYRFVLPDGTCVPDPASRYQPEDVHGPSEVIDPRGYGWNDEGWRGRPWEEAILYELHVGTFTKEGTFRAAMERLGELADLGITAIELMPIADFQGRWNWGYDGVLHFAPDSSYGHPDDLKALIDAAHARSMMVFLDVVYNHFGPDGNYMGLYAPILTDKHETPWGPAVNFDDEGSAMVREFVIANARYWLNEFHFDGLRFDAVHAIEDTGPQHLLKDLAEKLRASTDGRHIHLVVENSENQAGLDASAERWDSRPLHGPVERRRPSLPALRGDRRVPLVLRRLPREARSSRPVPGAGSWLPGRAHAARRQGQGRAQRAPAAYGFRHLHPEPRPGGEPSLRRQADRGRAAPGGPVAGSDQHTRSAYSRCSSWARSGAPTQPFLFFTDMGEELGRQDQARPPQGV